MIITVDTDKGTCTINGEVGGDGELLRYVLRKNALHADDPDPQSEVEFSFRGLPCPFKGKVSMLYFDRDPIYQEGKMVGYTSPPIVRFIGEGFEIVVGNEPPKGRAA